MSLTLGQAQAMGLRPPMGAVDPRPIPVRPTLWTFVRAAKTPEQQQRLAGEIVKHLPAPGRERVEAVYKLMVTCPMPVKPAALRVLRMCNPGLAGWQTLIMYCWIQDGSHVVVDGAGDRETLRKWFEEAELMTNPAPFWRPYVYTADELPEMVTLYRGGSDEEDFLRGGFSWTLERGIAALHVHKRQREQGGHGMVLKLTVPRDDILFCPKPQAEVVLSHATGGTLDTDDPAEIKKLAQSGLMSLMACREDCAVIYNASEDMWRGWDGDEQ